MIEYVVKEEFKLMLILFTPIKNQGIPTVNF